MLIFRRKTNAGNSKPRPLFGWSRFYAPRKDHLSVLVVVLILVNLLLEAGGGFAGLPWYYDNFGLSFDGFSSGKIWQLFTYGLLHGDWFHLLINLLLLWLAGRRVMEILGSGRCFLVILSGLLAGGLMHLLTGFLILGSDQPESCLVGISGACMALLLTLTTIMPDSHIRFLPIRGGNLGIGLIIAELILWLMHPGFDLPVFSFLREQWGALAGDGSYQISHACHLGGAVTGWLLARRLLTPVSIKKHIKQGQ